MKFLRISLCSLAALGLSTLATAQTSLPFSAQVLPSATGLPGVIELLPNADILDELTTLSAVVLTDFQVPGGRLDLELHRRSFDPLSAGVFVDGLPATYDPLDLTLWEGTVVGYPGSGVSLGFSSYGSYGWIDDGMTQVNVTSFASPTEGWSRARMRLYTEEANLSVGRATGPVCDSDSLVTGPGNPPVIDPRQVPPPAWSGVTLECRMAIESDYQYYQNWNNLQAAQNYMFNLLGAVSDRYLQQIDTVLSFPYVQFYTTSNDPWTATGSGSRLDEFRNAWSGNIPGGAHLAHMVSGANLGGGVAYLGALCSQSIGFAVSGNINGGVSFPVNQGSNTWDFVVTAHETGHNFGTPHTHDYCPPLDHCASNCDGNTFCTNQGTVMSYCHTCGAGMSNITTLFHPSVVTTMRNGAVNSCIPNYNGTTPTTLFSDGFESGDILAGGWSHGNLPGQVITAASHQGTYGCRIRNHRWMQKTFDTTGFSTVIVEVWRRTTNYDAGENLLLRMHDGNSWSTIEAIDQTDWGRLRVRLPASAGNNPNLVLRFKSKGSQGNERCDIDEVTILGQ